MKKLVTLIMCVYATVNAVNNWSQQEHYTIECDKDGQVMLCFKQECNIENEQHTQYNHPLVQPVTQPESPAIEKEPTAPSWISLNDLFTPIKIGCAGSLIIALYYFKAKLTLYSLSKSCIENAFWSLWQTKKQSTVSRDHDQDTALLYDILQTYRTDQHAIAISRFMQDVDAEIELLNRYLTEASNTQASILHFALPDMNNDIIEAQARLARLAYLKQKILSWLAYGTTGRAEEQWH